eukprot:1150549-Pelagomonas_calceolata.AAC.1
MRDLCQRCVPGSCNLTLPHTCLATLLRTAAALALVSSHRVASASVAPCRLDASRRAPSRNSRNLCSSTCVRCVCVCAHV